MTTAATTAATSAVSTGAAPVTRPMATPARATWPIPSPMSESRRWTRKMPTIGATVPTSSAAMSARCMKSTESRSITVGPPRRGSRRAVRVRRRAVGVQLEVVVVAVVVVVDAASRAAAYSWVVPSKRMRPLSTTTMRVSRRSRAPSSWVTMSIVTPRSTSRSRTSARTCWLAASTPAVGSSMMRTSGWPGESPRDEDPALLSAREGADLGGGAVGEADDVEGAGDDLPVGGPQPAEPADAGEPAGRRRSPRRSRGPRRRGCAAGGRSRGERGRAGRWLGTPKSVTLPRDPLVEPEHALHERRLAGTVRARRSPRSRRGGSSVSTSVRTARSP